MKAFTGTAALALAFLLGSCGSDNAGGNQATANASAPIETIAAPNGGDWTQMVSQTPEGGFIMGNPNAPVKLVEFGSFTCPHCAAFSEEGAPELVNEYVKSGQVSFEYRNFVRDSADLAASLLARCSGPTPFFKLTDQIFAAQNAWLGALQNVSPAEQQRLQALSPMQVPQAMAEQAGLIQFVRMRGIPEEKARACLSDQAATERLVNMTNDAVQRYQVPGTPAFLINGSLVESASEWKTLEPKIREAL